MSSPGPLSASALGPGPLKRVGASSPHILPTRETHKKGAEQVVRRQPRAGAVASRTASSEAPTAHSDSFH